MKLKYLTMLTVTSVLSLGVLVGCGNPCAAKDKPVTDNSEAVESDPCAGKSDPCAGK